MKPHRAASILGFEDMTACEIERGASAALACYEHSKPPGALLVGVSGIDGSGKGYVTGAIASRLEQSGVRAVVLNVDGWLNLPEVRFSRERPAERFYEKALRLDEMFEKLVLPLKQKRSVRLAADFTEETATSYRPHVYEYDDVDVIVLEGIYLFKREYREYFDLRLWIDCSFETALGRAIARAQEGLPPEETVSAYRTIYFPAQEIHFERDDPRGAAHLVLRNDEKTMREPAAF
jgi:uridine kinase